MNTDTSKSEYDVFAEYKEIATSMALHAARGFLHRIDSNDVIQYGMIGFISAIRNYDQSKGSSFRSYLYRTIKATVIDGLRSEKISFRRVSCNRAYATAIKNTQIGIPSIDYPVYFRDPQTVPKLAVTHNGFDNVDNHDYVQFLITKLDQECQDFLSFRHLNEHSLKEAGKEFGYTESAACQKDKKIMNILRIA